MGTRKIIHVDTDAFYASVEQRDDPQLRGKPVVVARRGNRSVVCAASYEARAFGVRSAMPARRIREQIRQELNLTASAGVAPNKFLAKLASDWRKPDGLFVIRPEEVDTFLLPLRVERLPGVGKVTGEKLAKLRVQTVEDLRKLELPALEQNFGRYGLRLHELARGIDESEVVPDRPTQSISVEDTFESDVPLAETEPMIRHLAEKLWFASRKESRIARTVVLKLKTSEFKILTRSHTPFSPPSTCEELTEVALKLRERVDLGSRRPLPTGRQQRFATRAKT